jgi:hypothetical protein
VIKNLLSTSIVIEAISQLVQILLTHNINPLIFEIFDLMFSDWVSFLAYPNLFGIKGLVVVVVVVV